MSLIDDYNRISSAIKQNTDLDKWHIDYFYTKTRKITLRFESPNYPADTIANICQILDCQYTDLEMMVRNQQHYFIYQFPTEDE